MKKRILALVLCTVLIIGLAACGGTVEEVAPKPETPSAEPTVMPPVETPPAFDCEVAYGDVLTRFCELIAHPENETEFDDGVLGAYEAAESLGDAALDTVGYVFRDLNGDGEEELLIGCFEAEEYAYVQNEIYAVYTYDGQQPQLLFEGRSRSAYSLTDADTFFYFGSNGAIYSIFGEYALGEDGAAECLDFYFTHEKDENLEDVRAYHNTTGEWNPEISEELEISLDDFWKMQDALAQKTVTLESVKFSTLAPEEVSDLAALQAEIKAAGKLVGVAYLGFVEYDAPFVLEETAADCLDEYPFLKDVTHFAENEGYRAYCIVPADDSVTVSVHVCEFDAEYMPCAGEELVSATAPIIVRGNVGDTVPNLYVVARTDSETVEYTPVQSGMDGRLSNNEDKVYDFTPYDKMAEFGARS